MMLSTHRCCLMLGVRNPFSFLRCVRDREPLICVIWGLRRHTQTDTIHPRLPPNHIPSAGFTAHFRNILCLYVSLHLANKHRHRSARSFSDGEYDPHKCQNGGWYSERLTITDCAEWPNVPRTPRFAQRRQLNCARELNTRVLTRATSSTFSCLEIAPRRSLVLRWDYVKVCRPKDVLGQGAGRPNTKFERRFDFEKPRIHFAEVNRDRHRYIHNDSSHLDDDHHHPSTLPFIPRYISLSISRPAPQDTPYRRHTEYLQTQRDILRLCFVAFIPLYIHIIWLTRVDSQEDTNPAVMRKCNIMRRSTMLLDNHPQPTYPQNTLSGRRPFTHVIMVHHIIRCTFCIVHFSATSRVTHSPWSYRLTNLRIYIYLHRKETHIKRTTKPSFTFEMTKHTNTQRAMRRSALWAKIMTMTTVVPHTVTRYMAAGTEIQMRVLFLQE